MSTKILAASLFAIAFCLCQPTSAADEIVVEIHNRVTQSPPLCFGESTQLFFDEDEDIVIGVGFCTERINVYAFNSSHDIGHLRIQGTTGSNPLEVVISSGGIIQNPDAQYTVAGRNWKGISFANLAQIDDTELGGHIAADLVEYSVIPGTKVRIGQLWRFDIGGELQQDIEVTSDGIAFNRLFANSVSSGSGFLTIVDDLQVFSVTGDCNGSIAAMTANIDVIEIGGNLAGDVYALNGGIQTINVTGDIGTPTDPIIISASDNIIDIDAQSIHANISVDTTNPTGGRIHHVASSVGDITGSLTTKEFLTGGSTSSLGLTAAHDLDNELFFTQSVGEPIQIDGSLAPTACIVYRNTLMDAGSISIDDGQGLQGQIIINGINTTHDWLGPIRIGRDAQTGLYDIVLDPFDENDTSTLYYSQTAAQLGGGSIGLVPFQVHATDCVPIDEAVLSIPTSPDPNNPIQVRHYGPVTWDSSGDNQPIRVARRIPPSGTWEDITGCLSFAADSNANIVIVTPADGHALHSGYEYKLHPELVESDSLMCDIPDFTGLPDVLVADYDGNYSFEVEPWACPGDANYDNAVDILDLNFVLGNFQTSMACFPPAGDLNEDLVVDILDLNIVLGNFQSTCGSQQAQSGGSGGASGGPGAAAAAMAAQSVPPILEYLGWDDMGAYVEWVTSLDEDGQWDHALELIEAAKELEMLP